MPIVAIKRPAETTPYVPSPGRRRMPVEPQAPILVMPRPRIRRRPRQSDAPIFTVPVSVPSPAPASTEPSAPKKSRPNRGKATKNEQGKWQAVEGNVGGFCLPPVKGQFKGTPGPGRPKGSRSQDSITREALSKKVRLKIDGVHRNMQKRQLAVELLVKKALEKQDDRSLFKLIEMAARLFPERPAEEAKATPLGDAALDKMLIDMFRLTLTMGEPDPNATDDPGGDSPSAAQIDPSEDGAWSEGDWSAPGDSASDDDGDRDEDGDDGE